MTFYSVTLARTIRLPDDGLRTKTCRSIFHVLMCKFYKFYICAVVGIIIKYKNILERRQHNAASSLQSICHASHIPLNPHITHLLQQCHNSKFVIFQEKCLKVLKCHNFL